MTNKEAIEQFKERLAITDYRQQIPEYYEAIELAVEALEKQIPKKPYGTNGDWAKLSMNRCPYCKAYPLGPNDNYCPNCGQALDWEEDDD